MFLSKKIRLLPTPEQEILFWKSAGVARWAYNFFLGENERIYKEYLANNQTGIRYIKGNDIRKYINNTLKPTTHKWLSEVSSSVMKQAVKDAEKNLNSFFHGETNKPRFKSKKKSKPSFYVNYESLIRTNNGFRGERIGCIKTTESLPKLNKGQHYLKPYITYNGDNWFLSVTYEATPINTSTTGMSLGIDLGVKDLAICSDGVIYKNINRTPKMKKLEKRLKQARRKMSRKIKANTKYVGSHGEPHYDRDFLDCKNFQKQKAIVRKLYRRIWNIRNNYIHQTTTEIVKTKPSRIVIEKLIVKNMIKNRSVAKAISDQCFYEFRRQMTYKCELYGIELILADTFYPSSKTCSCCGNIKKELKLSDRVYHCDCCGLTIDRDYNAAINLSKYNL